MALRSSPPSLRIGWLGYHEEGVPALLDLLEIDLEDLGSEVGDEVLGDLGVVNLVVLAQGGWVAVSVFKSVELGRIGVYSHT